jgi:diacylglycerol O-acyltransferase
MPALSVLDLAVFLLESRERHFNVGPLIVVDPPPKQRAKFADRLLARMMKRPVGPPFNYKLRTPLLGVPSLEVDAELDLSRHVHRITLDAPGTLRQLFDRVCKLHERLLDRAHPLWELYVIDGLEGGKVALFGRMHHGVIDGRTFVTASLAMAGAVAHRAHGACDVGGRAAARARRRPAGGPARAGAACAGQGKGHRGERRVAVPDARRAGAGPRLASAAATRCCCPSRASRRCCRRARRRDGTFDFCNLPIPAMKALGKAHGVSLNDMLLLTLDVALARYLHDIGKQPDKPLGDGDAGRAARRRGGNQIAILQFPLGAPACRPRRG